MPENNDFDLSALESQDFDFSAIEQDFDLSSLEEEDYQAPIKKEEPGLFQKVKGTVATTLNNVAASYAATMASIPGAAKGFAAYGAAMDTSPEGVQRMQEMLSKDDNYFQAEAYKGALEVMNNVEDMPRLNQDFITAFKDGDIGGLLEAGGGAILDVILQGVLSKATMGTSMFSQGIGLTYLDTISQKVDRGESVEEAVDDFGAVASSWIAGGLIGAAERLGLEKVFGQGVGNNFKQKFSRIIGALVTEGSTEFFQEYFQMIGAAAGDKGQRLKAMIAAIKDNPEGFLQALNAGIAGMVGGGVMQTAQQALGAAEEATVKTESGEVKFEGKGAKVVANKVASVAEKKAELDGVASVAKVAPEHAAAESELDKEAAAIEKALDPEGFTETEDDFAKKLEEAAAKAEEKASKTKKKDAVQEQKPAEVDVRQQAADGQTVGEGDAQGQVTPQEGAQIAEEEDLESALLFRDYDAEEEQVAPVEAKEKAKPGRPKKVEEEKPLISEQKRPIVEKARVAGVKAMPRIKGNAIAEKTTKLSKEDASKESSKIGKLLRFLNKAGVTVEGDPFDAVLKTDAGDIVFDPEKLTDFVPEQDATTDDVVRGFVADLDEKAAAEFEAAYLPPESKTKASIKQKAEDTPVEDLSPYYLNKIANEQGNPRAAAAKTEIERRDAARKKEKAQEREARQKEEREIAEQERVRKEKERVEKEKQKEKERAEKEAEKAEKQEKAEKKEKAKEEKKVEKEEKKSKKELDQSIALDMDRAKYFSAKKKGGDLSEWSKTQKDLFDKLGEITAKEVVAKYDIDDDGKSAIKKSFINSRNAAQAKIQKRHNSFKDNPSEKNKQALYDAIEGLALIYEGYSKTLSQASIDNYIHYGNIAGQDRHKFNIRIEKDDEDRGGDYGVEAISETSTDLRPGQLVPLSRIVNRWLGLLGDPASYLSSKVDEVTGEQLMNIVANGKKYGKANQIALSGLLKMAKLLGYEMKFYASDGAYSVKDRHTAGGYQQFSGNKIAIVVNTRASDEYAARAFLHEVLHGMTNHLVRRFADNYLKAGIQPFPIDKIMQVGGMTREDAKAIYTFLKRADAIYGQARQSWEELSQKVAEYVLGNPTDPGVVAFLGSGMNIQKEANMAVIIKKVLGVSNRQAAALAPHMNRFVSALMVDWQDADTSNIYDPYILKNIDEMIAGIAGPYEAALLAALPVRRGPKFAFADVKEKAMSVFDAILHASKEFIREFLGINSDIEIVNEHWNSALDELHSALIEWETNMFGGLLSQAKDVGRFAAVERIFETADAAAATYSEMQEGSKPRRRRDIVKTLTSYMAKAKVDSIEQLQAFANKINESGRMGANPITQAEIERAYEMRLKQIARNTELREKAAEERIRKALIEEQGMDVKDRLIKVISEEMRNFYTYNRADIRKLLAVIKGEKNPANFEQHAMEAIRILRGIEYQKQLQKGRAIQKSVKFKESIPINEKKLFRDVRTMDLEILSSEQLDRFIVLAENVQKNAVDTSSTASGFANSSLHGLLSMKDFVEEYKLAQNKKMNSANTNIGDGDFLDILAKPEKEAEAVAKAKKASAKEDRERTALYKIIGVTYFQMRRSGIIDQWMEGRSRQFKATVEKFFDIINPKDKRSNSFAKMSLKDLRRFVQSLEYFARYGELTNFAGQAIVFDQAARRVSLSLNNGRVKNKVRQLSSAKDIFDARTPTQLVEFAAKMIKDVRNALNELFFANLKMLDAQIHEQHRQIMTRIHEKAQELKLNEENLVRIQLFSNIFATKSNPNVDGKAAYLAEVKGNIAKYGKALVNKMRAAKEEKHAGLDVADVEKEMKIFDDLVKSINEHGKFAALSEKEHEFRNMMLSELEALKPEFRQATIAFAGKEWQEWYEYVPTKAIGSVASSDEYADKNMESLMKLMEFNPTVNKLPDYESTHARERRTTVGGAYYENNIINSMNSYILRALYDTHVLPEVMTLNHIVNNKRVHEDVGKQNVNVVKNSLQKAVRRGRGEYVERSRVVVALEQIKNIYVIGKLGNAWQLANQLLSMLPSIAIMHPKGFIKATQVLMNPSSIDWGDPNIKNFSDWIKVHGHGLQNRDVTFERFQSIEDYNAWKQGYQKWTKKQLELSTYMLRKADAWSASMTFLSSYLGSGGTFANPDFAKMASAEADTDLIQNASNPRFASSLFRPDSQEARILVSFLYTFKSFAVNQSLTALGSIRNINTPRGKRVLAASVANIVMYQLMVIGVANVLNSMTGAAAQLVLDDDDWEKLRQRMKARNEARRKNLLEKLIFRSANDIFLAWMPEILETASQKSIDWLRAFINDDILMNYQKSEPVFFNKERPGSLANGFGGYSGMGEAADDLFDVGGIAWNIYSGEELEDNEVVVGLLQSMATAVTYAPFIPFRGDMVKIMNNLASVMRTEPTQAKPSEALKKHYEEQNKMREHKRETAKKKQKRGLYNFMR
jgi:hypothetical protein